MNPEEQAFQEALFQDALEAESVSADRPRPAGVPYQYPNMPQGVGPLTEYGPPRSSARIDIGSPVEPEPAPVQSTARQSRRTSSQPMYEGEPLGVPVRMYPTHGRPTGTGTYVGGGPLDFDIEIGHQRPDFNQSEYNLGAAAAGALNSMTLGNADVLAGAVGGEEAGREANAYIQDVEQQYPESVMGGAVLGAPLNPLGTFVPPASSAAWRTAQMGALGASIGGAGQVARNYMMDQQPLSGVAQEAAIGGAVMGGGQLAAEVLSGAPAAWMRQARRGLAEQRALSNAVTPSERAAVRQAVAEEMPYPQADLPELGPAPQRPLRERMPVRQPAEPIPARLPQPPLASAVRPAPSGQISPDMRRLANHGIADTIQFNEGEEAIAADIADRLFAGSQNQLDRFGAATRSLRGLGQQYEQLAAAGRGVRVDTRDMLREAERVAALNPDDALTQDAIEKLRRAVSVDRISNSPPTAAFDELHRIKVEAGASPIGRVIRDALVRGAPDDLAQQMVALDTEFKIARDVQSRGRGVSQFVSDEQAAQASQAQYQERLNNYQRAVQDITARNNARNSRYLESVSRANTVEEIAAANDLAKQQYMADMAQRNATREEIIAGRRELEEQIREINQARNLDVQERVRGIENERRIQRQYDQIGVHDVGLEAGRRFSTGALDVIEYIVDSPHLVASTIGKILPAEAIELLSRSRKNGTMAAAVYQLSHSYPNFSQYVVEPSHPEE